MNAILRYTVLGFCSLILHHTAHIDALLNFIKMLKNFLKFFGKNFENFFQKSFFGCQMKIFGLCKKNFFYYYFIVFVKLSNSSICLVKCKFKLQKPKTVYLRIAFIPFLWPKCHYQALSEVNYFLQSASGYPVLIFGFEYLLVVQMRIVESKSALRLPNNGIFYLLRL